MAWSAGDGVSLPEDRPKAHIRDVARAAGVSHQTVSRVLNQPATVRPHTRDRVLVAIRELDYRPSVAARALNTGRTRALGVLTFDAARFGPVSVLHGIGEAAWERGYLLNTVALRTAGASAVRQAIDRLVDQAVDGIIVITGREAVARAVPHVPHGAVLVLVDDTFDERIPAVGVDGADGARQAVQHLLALGHRTVWHVAGPPGWIAAAEREAGWRAALQDAGRDAPPPLYGDWTAESGYRLGRRLAARPDVTAVFAANDQMALGLMHAVHDAGARIPADVSVVGFDDVPEAAHFLPPLTTVRVDFIEVGRRCLTLVLDRLENGASPTGRTVVAPRLVTRHSTGAPPARHRDGAPPS